MKKYNYILVLMWMLLAAGPSFGQDGWRSAAPQKYIDKVAVDKIFRGSQLGVMAVKVNGDTVAAINPEKRLLPASNTKLLTTGLALNEFGPEHRFATKLAYSGAVDGNGVLHGDLYIIGGGDPTLASGDSIATPTEELFSIWKGFVDAAGIKAIEGKIVGDGRYFNGMYIPRSWQYADLGTYYGTGGQGLSFYINAQDFRVAAGKNVGDPVSVELVYPQTPWMKFYYECTTGQPGTGDELYLYTSEFAPVAVMRGTFAVDRRPKTEGCANMFPALTCAWYFSEFLSSNGISVSGGAADLDYNGFVRTEPVLGRGLYRAAENLVTIGQTLSPTVEQIARVTNWRSDNYYAETLYRHIGLKRAASADYAACQEAEAQAFAALGVCSEEVSIEDGSGLSRHDYLTPSFFCTFLKAMMGSQSYEAYLRTIGWPGHGMYETRLAREPQSLKSRIRYKSGSMGGVRCYSGYVFPKSGRAEDTIVFSVLVNNCLASSEELFPVLDKIIALIADEN